MAAENTRDYMVRFTGQSDGFVKAVNTGASAVGRLVSVLANLTRGASLALPAMAVKSTVVGLLASQFRRLSMSAMEAFETIDSGLLNLENRTLLSARQISGHLTDIFDVARRAGMETEAVVEAVGAASRGGLRGSDVMFGAQAGVAASLVMGGSADQWAQIGAEGAVRHGMNVEDYLGNILAGSRRGLDKSAVDEMIAGGKGLQDAGEELRIAANRLRGSAEFIKRRADTAWGQIGQRWGAALDDWGIQDSVQKLKYGVATLATAPADRAIRARQNVTDRGWWRWLMGIVTPTPQEYKTEFDRDVIPEHGDYYDEETGYWVKGRVSDEEWAENMAGARRQVSSWQAQKGRQWHSDAARRLLGGVTSDREMMNQSMEHAANEADKLKTATERAARLMDNTANAVARAEGAYSALANVVGSQANLQALGIPAQLRQLQTAYGPYFEHALMSAKYDSNATVLERAKAIVTKEFGSAVTDLVDWSQFEVQTGGNNSGGGGGGGGPSLMAFSVGAPPGRSAAIAIQNQEDYAATGIRIGDRVVVGG